MHDGSTRVISVLAAETYVIHGPEGSYELSFVVNGNDIEITTNTIPRDAPGGDVLPDPKKAWKEYQNRKRTTGAADRGGSDVELPQRGVRLAFHDARRLELRGYASALTVDCHRSWAP